MFLFVFFDLIFSNFINKRKQNKKHEKKGKNSVHSRNRLTNAQRKSRVRVKLQKFEKYLLISRLAVVINRYFPDFYQQLTELPDYRKRRYYEVKELIISGLLMFLFEQKSRNSADAKAKFEVYQENIYKLFKIRVADMDTVDRYLRFLKPERLERLKQLMLKELLKSKLLHKHRLFNQFFLIAIDGTSLHSYDYEPYQGCPYKQLKSGRKIWTTYVLEAKLVSLNGFALSVATEWIENPTDKVFDKQDSELKAFKRLAKKLKKSFPGLPIVVLLDGLYPNKSIFEICRDYHWSYIITLKDKSLKSVQEQIADMNYFKKYKEDNFLSADSTHWYRNSYKFFENIEYHRHRLYVVETYAEKQHKKTGEIEQNRFVHITDIIITKSNVHQVSIAGRSRWKIENLGFQIQKETYHLRHKFSRTNFNATKNYYQLLQIAHIINQLTYKLKFIKDFAKENGLSIIAVKESIFIIINAEELTDIELINNILTQKQQLQY